MTHSIYVTMAPHGSRVTVRMGCEQVSGHKSLFVDSIGIAKIMRAESLHGDKNLVTLDFDLKLAMHERLAGLMLPCAHIELPPMPGAGDDAALQLAFAERPPLMRANAVQGMNRTFDIEESDDPVSGYTLFCRSGRKFVDGGNLMPGSHFWCWPNCRSSPQEIQCHCL
jgi:hypothetical protein